MTETGFASVAAAARRPRPLRPGPRARPAPPHPAARPARPGRTVAPVRKDPPRRAPRAAHQEARVATRCAPPSLRGASVAVEARRTTRPAVRAWAGRVATRFARGRAAGLPGQAAPAATAVRCPL